MFLSKYGVGRHIYIPIVKRAVVDFSVSADWTPATGDVKISKDGGAFTNVTNLPTAIASANTGAVWDFSVTATELQCAQAVVVVSDAATKAVEDQAFIIETYGNASGQHAFDLATATVAPTAASITSSSFAAGAITAAAIATDAIGADELAADGVTEIVTAVQTTRGWAGLLAAGSTNTITLGTGSSAVNGAYNSFLVVTWAGAGANQYNIVNTSPTYNGGTKVATMVRNWDRSVDNTTYVSVWPLT